MSDGLAIDTLYLACTRPAMRWGVPLEGFAINFGGSWIFGMIAGSPFYWVIGVFIHYCMKPMANKNPNFFRELRMWFDTKGVNAGGTLWALSPDPPRHARDIPSCI